MSTLIHVVVGYFFLLLTVRVLMRRPGAQLTPFEFVIIFLIGGIIITATVGSDRSLTNCTSAVIMVGLVHRTVSVIRARFPKAAQWIDGSPMVLFENGCWKLDAMEGLHIDEEDVLAAAREQGLTSLSQVKYAVAESNGVINIIKA